MHTPDDLAAKRRFIEAFFNNLRERASFVDLLYEGAHKDEAMLLVCCYIEALGNGLDATEGIGGRNFVTAIVQYGGNPMLALIHPKLLKSSLPYKSVAPAERAAVKDAIDALPDDQMLAEMDLLEALTPRLSSSALAFVTRELWRARVAAIAYSNIRSLGAHWFGGPDSVSFSTTTYRGRRVPEIDFPALRQVLDRITEHAEVLSLQTTKWFGRF